MTKALQNNRWVMAIALLFALNSFGSGFEGNPYQHCATQKGSKSNCATCDLPPELRELANPAQLLTMAPAEALTFLTLVGEKVEKSYEKAEKELTYKISCFAGNADKSCDKDLGAIKTKLQADSKKLHTELGIARAIKGNYQKDSIAAYKGKEINWTLSDVESPLSKLIALDSQRTAGQKEYQAALNSAKEAMQKSYMSTGPKDTEMKAGKIKPLSQFQKEAVDAQFAKHQQAALEVMFFENPLLAHMPATTLQTGKYVYPDNAIRDALFKQREVVAREKARVKKALDESKMDLKIEKSRITGASLVNATLMKWMGKEELALMDFAVMTPAVEAVLKENPKYCNLATALAARYGIEKDQNGLASFPLIGAAFVGMGVGVAAVGATATAAEIIMGGAGVALGAGFTYDSYHKLKEAEAIAGAMGKDSMAVTPEKLAEARAEWQMAKYASPLNLIGTGAFFKFLTQGSYAMSKRLADSLTARLKSGAGSVASKIKELKNSTELLAELELMGIPKAKQAAVAACFAVVLAAGPGHTMTAAQKGDCEKADVIVAETLAKKGMKEGKAVVAAPVVEANTAKAAPATAAAPASAKNSSHIGDLSQEQKDFVASYSKRFEAADSSFSKELSTFTGENSKKQAVFDKRITELNEKIELKTITDAEKAEMAKIAKDRDALLDVMLKDQKAMEAKWRANLSDKDKAAIESLEKGNSSMKKAFIKSDAELRNFEDLRLQMILEDEGFAKLPPVEQERKLLGAYRNMEESGLVPAIEAERILTVCGKKFAK